MIAISGRTGPAALGAAAVLAGIAVSISGAFGEQMKTHDQMRPHGYVGMWVTADGRIRQELLPNGRYDEARGALRSAYQGRYEIRGTHIDYWDDTGFTAHGTFVTHGELHHGGMIFYREKQPTRP